MTQPKWRKAIVRELAAAFPGLDQHTAQCSGAPKCKCMTTLVSAIVAVVTAELDSQLEMLRPYLKHEEGGQGGMGRCGSFSGRPCDCRIAILLKPDTLIWQLEPDQVEFMDSPDVWRSLAAHGWLPETMTAMRDTLRIWEHNGIARRKAPQA